MDTAVATSLDQPDRLQTLHSLGLLDTPAQPNFDRLTQLTARVLKAPVSLITLVTDDRQFFKSTCGLAEPWATARETPLSHSFCQYVVASGEPLVVDDARTHPLLHTNLAITEIGVVAYAGIPLVLDGQVLGALCAIDAVPRTWDAGELELLTDIAAAVITEMALIREVAARTRAEQVEAVRRHCLEVLAAGHPLSTVLTVLASGIETQLEGGRCAIMLLDESGQYISTCAAPSIPTAFSDAIDGTQIGPNVGSCGTAAYLGKRIISADIANDPRWLPWREVALAHQLRACWSTPFFDSTGMVLGTFALYDSVPRSPGAVELTVVEDAASVAAVAVEHWRTQAALQSSRANLIAVFEHSLEAIWMVDKHYRLAVFNSRLEDWFGRISQQPLVVGSTPEALCLPAEAAFWRAQYDRAMSSGQFVIEETYEIKREKIVIEMSFNPTMVDGEVIGITIFCRDITKRKRREEQRLMLERALQETQRLESLGVLAGGIAHDFNNLLAAILGNTGLALTEVAPTSLAWESLKEIELAAERAAALTRQMLAYAGRGRFVIQPLDINQLITEMAHLLRAALPRPIPLRYQLGGGLPLIEGDANQLCQVVMNLIVNGAEALGEQAGEVLLRTTTRQINAGEVFRFAAEQPLAPGLYLSIEVIDTGCGMDAETLDKIFEPFFTTKFTGRGLGLAAVLGIVRGHHGALQVASTLGSGTHFTVLLPCYVPPAAADEAALPEASMPGPARGVAPDTASLPVPNPVVVSTTHAVLVVDDEAAVRQVVARMAAQLGYDALTAADLPTALDLLHAHPHRLVAILQDWTLPGMRGSEGLQMLARIRPDLPIIVMSGYDAEDISAQLAHATPAGVLQKPFGTDALRTALASILRQRTV